MDGEPIKFSMNNRLILKNKRFIEEAILFFEWCLTLVGMGITDFSPEKSHYYWTFLVFIFAIISIGLGWSREESLEKLFKRLVIRQLIHWGATLLTVSGVYILLSTGRLNYESTGLVIELIIGFSLFLDGRDLGWRVSLLGVLVGITAILAACIEEYIWVILTAFIFIFIISHYLENKRRDIKLKYVCKK